jgi:hypothetical protein
MKALIFAILTATAFGRSLNETQTAEEALDTATDGSKFWTGFTQAFLLILISEIGDATFIMVTIYAAKIKWWLVLLITIVCTGVMHCLSVGLGAVFTLFIPKIWT